MYPKYEYPTHLYFKLIYAMLLRRRRDFHVDALGCIRTLDPPLRILGSEHIPPLGPCLVVMNHYSRPGFRVWWLSMAISSLLTMPHAWIIASEWTAPGQWYEPLKETWSRFVSQRLAHTYGFLRMPPMPPRPQDVAERAASVRAALNYVEKTPNAVLCIAPEGRDMPEGRLGWPASGTGRFLSLLAECGLLIVPVGGWEEAGALTVRFGAGYRLEVQRGTRAEVRDRLATEIVMRSLAGLLPESLRGEFV
jgi:hypothetical protein